MANLDPQVTNALRAARRAEQNPVPELEPSFPYAKISFDPFFFGADAEVDTEHEEASS
ncbi:MAG: hypothetical protein WCF18_09015 [Chthoniobacteraceae bacterium]